MAVQKPSAMDKARSKTAVLAAGVQEDLNKLREKLTVKNVRLFQQQKCPLLTCWALSIYFRAVFLPEPFARDPEACSPS